MVAFNEKNRWVFPLVPTASAYTKLDKYVGKLRNSKIERLQAQGAFGENFSSAESFAGKKATTER